MSMIMFQWLNLVECSVSFCIRFTFYLFQIVSVSHCICFLLYLFHIVSVSSILMMFRGKTFCRGYWLILPCSPLSPIFNYFFLRQPPCPHPGPPPHRSPHQPPCPPPYSLICSHDECSFPDMRVQLLCPQFSVVLFQI